MPVNTVPQRCRETCPDCQQSGDGGFHQCVTEATCCECFSSNLTVEHIPLPADQLTDTITQYVIDVTWSTVENAWTGNVTDGVNIVGTIRLYFERVDGVCLFLLRSTILGYPEGSEKTWTLGDCDALHFATLLSDGSTIVINGDQPRDSDLIPCSTLCCEPAACFTMTVIGSVTSAEVDDPAATDSEGFELTLTFGESIAGGIFGSPVTYFPITSSCGATAFSSTEFTLSMVCDNTVTVEVTGQLTERNLIVRVSAGTVAYQHAFYTQLYEVAQHEPGTECEARTLTLLESTSSGGSDFACGNGALLTLAMSDATEIVPDFDCVPAASPCAVFPRCLTFRVSGVTDNVCTECDFNASWTVYRSAGTCVWYSTSITSGHCLSTITGATYLQWKLVFDDDDDSWTLGLIAYDVSNAALGVLVTYELIGDSSPVFAKSIARTAFSSACATWPATLSLTTCSGGNLIYGACCENIPGVPCEEMTKAQCDDVGGTFLGAGTRCGLEGCSGCSMTCEMFCEEYSFRNHLFSACVDVDFSQTLTRTTDCNWFGDSGSWQFDMDIDTTVSPPERTIHVTGIADDMVTTIEFDAVQNHDAYCSADSVVFRIENWVSTCTQPASGDKTLILTNLTDCPENNG